jgi:hypothetical protein
VVVDLQQGPSFSIQLLVVVLENGMKLTYDKRLECILSTDGTRLNEVLACNGQILVNELRELLWAHGFQCSHGKKALGLWIVHSDTVDFVCYSSSKSCAF